MASIAVVSLCTHRNPNEAYTQKGAQTTTMKRRDRRKLKDRRSNKKASITIHDDKLIEPIKTVAPVGPSKEDKEPNNTINLIPPVPASKEEKIWEPIPVDLDVVGRDKVLRGHPLADIYSVRIIDLGGKSSSKIHGQIELRGALDVENLFLREKENALSVEVKGLIQLRGPMLPIIAYDPYSVRFYLEEGDDSWCEGNVWWSPYHYTVYDKPMIKTIEGPSGSVEITYITFKDAIIAELEVKILSLKNRDAVARISGTVSASIEGRDLTSIMFCKKEHEGLTMSPQDMIPMSKPSLSVPRASALIVAADLWDSSFSHNKPLAQGALLFKPGYCGEYISTIEGECGAIQVKVSWFPMPKHPPTIAAELS